MTLRALYLVVPLLTLALPPAGAVKCRCEAGSAIDFSSEESFRKLGYRSWEVFDPATYTRRVYLGKDGDPRGRLIYTHGRGIAIALVHHGRMALIND